MNYLDHFPFQSSYLVRGDFSHGSIQNALNHKAMMEYIANDIVKQALECFEEDVSKRMEEQQKAVYQQAIQDLLQALEYDVESVVDVGMNGCEKIFHDKKTQKIISDRIMQEITKKLKSKW